MQSQLKISDTTLALLRCPVCDSKLRHDRQEFTCLNAECGHRFPIINGIPILINDDASVFSTDDFISHQETFFPRASQARETLLRFIPTISLSLKSKENYQKLTRSLLALSERPRVLVLGGSILGKGMESLAGTPAIELVESDVSFGPRTALICDAQDIPFEDQSFDAVIAQAVLQHVVDPYRCVEQIYRVLKKDGIVYAESPFMQQVHGGRYDFTRFTHLGHRRLFRRFEELDSGSVCGPGMALAWSYQYFLLSFTTSKTLRVIIKIFARFTAFYLKYFDYYLINQPAALDAASGFYFMGKKSNTVLSDRDLLKLYRGADND